IQHVLPKFGDSLRQFFRSGVLFVDRFSHLCLKLDKSIGLTRLKALFVVSVYLPKGIRNEPKCVPDVTNGIPDEPKRIPYMLKCKRDVTTRILNASKGIHSAVKGILAESARIADEPKRIPYMSKPIPYALKCIRDEVNSIPYGPQVIRYVKKCIRDGTTA